MRAKATYQPKKWEEVTTVQISSTQKTTKARVEFTYLGELVGTALVEYLMFYRSFNETDHTRSEADYVGLLFFEGKVNGLAGSFVMRDQGVFENGVANSSLSILEDSGMGELKGISGKGRYRSTPAESMIELEYEIQAQIARTG